MTFARIYAENRWNGVESLSGPGSGTAATAPVAKAILGLVAELGVHSVLDAACGDSFWMPDLPGYIGMDIAPEAVDLAQRAHPERAYLVGDVRRTLVPAFDLVIFRDAMQHMPLADGVKALESIKRSGSRWLLASTYAGGENVDVPDGDYFSPDLIGAPYLLGVPNRLIPDGYHYDDSPGIRDPGKFLGLWKLR